MKQISGVYALCSDAGTPLHLSWSTNLERRLKRLFVPRKESGPVSAAPLREKFATVECWPAASKLELNLLLYALARRIHPDRYLRFLKLRPPWFVGVLQADAFPRLETTDRPQASMDPVWGPFRTRASAQQYEVEVTSLFQIRRCTENLKPSPAHPGCVYGEMSQCLRPCQEAVSSDEYASEAGRVVDFLRTNGRSAIATLSVARDRACEEAAFEQAAQIHKRVEKMKATAQLREPVITELHAFNGIALTPSLETGQCRLWPMFGSTWQNPLSFTPAEIPTGTSLDSALREMISASMSSARPGGNPVEELAVFSRWYYSSWRDGHWFPFADKAGIPYRKLVREISKMTASAAQHSS